MRWRWGGSWPARDRQSAQGPGPNAEHAAQAGSVNVLSGAPYGYRYVTKHEGGGQAQYEILLEEARVVRQIFAWVGRDRESIGTVCRRLQAAGKRTRTGRTTWDRSVVWGILKNPAYKGEAAYGKTYEGPPQPRLRTQRHRPLQPRRPHSTQDRPDDELFASVQEQLTENRRRARLGQRGVRYLLQGLIWCSLPVCLIWEGTQPECPQRPPTQLRLLSLHRHGRLPLRRAADLRQSASADRPAGCGRLGAGAELAEPAGAPGD